MPKSGFSLQAQYSQPITQVIALLKTFGFSAVSPVWSPELDLASLAACVREHNMTIQSLHAPHKGIPLLWTPDAPASFEVQERIFACIDACEQYSVPIMVIHGWQGLVYTFPDTPLDFRFFDRMVDYARLHGVSIAFENLEGEEYLEALLKRYSDEPHIGFCWDSGHDHCYPHRLDFLKSFGHRLIMTHLNDNLGLRDPSGIPSGKDDLHFMPYDGNIDWDYAVRNLKAAAHQEILNFEIKTQTHSTDPADLPYVQQPLEVFLLNAADRARKIAELYEK